MSLKIVMCMPGTVLVVFPMKINDFANFISANK